MSQEEYLVCSECEIQMDLDKMEFCSTCRTYVCVNCTDDHNYMWHETNDDSDDSDDDYYWDDDNWDDGDPTQLVPA